MRKVSLKRCPTCDEKRNPARRILRGCDGYPFGSCGIGRTRQPITSYLDGEGRISHGTRFSGMRGCDNCRDPRTVELRRSA